MIGWLERHMRRTIPASIPYADPLHAGRHPFQTFMLVLCIASGLPLLFGQPTSGSIESNLPHWMAVTWGLSLLVGSTLGLLGSFWRGDYDTGLLLERMGLDLAGFAAVAYSVIVVISTGWLGLLAGAIVLGFGASCLTRARDIGRIFHRARGDS